MIQMTFLQGTPTVVLALILCVLLIVFYIIGHRVRAFQVRRNPAFGTSDLATINGMLLGLLGLLLAFTFSMSNSRYDTRRALIIEEANNIGTVVLRADVYPDSMRTILRQSLREYVEARIAFYQVGMNMQQVYRNYFRADSVGQAIWRTVANYARVDNITTRTSEMIPALNAMIDITTTRRAAGEATIPDSIMYFLFSLCLGSAFLLGYDHKGPMNWVIVLGFAVMLSSVVFTIIDMDRPRSGLINLDVPNQRIVDLRGMFK